MQHLSSPGRQGGPRQLYRAFWRFAAGDRRRVVSFVVLLVLAQALKLLIPYFSGQAVNAMQGTTGPDVAGAGTAMALTFVACLVAWVLHGPGRVIERFVALRVRERFCDALYAKVVGLPMRWHQEHHSGDTIQRVNRAGLALHGFSQNQFIYLQNIVSLVGPIIALLLLSVPTGLAALAGYAVIAVVLVRFDRTMVRLSAEEVTAEGRYTAALVDCLGNVSTVLTLRLQEATRRMAAGKLARVFLPLRRSVVVNETKWCAIDLLNNFIRSGLVVLYGWLAWRQEGAILLGSAVMVYQYAQQAGGVVSSMAANYQDLVRYQTDFAGVGHITAAAGAEGTACVPEDWREIRVTDLCFAHAGAPSNAPALREISLTLRRGRRIALVGESGCGKSTLLRVLAGLYGADTAVFEVDGELRAELRHLGSIATLVPQDPEVFENTIGHNITMGIDYAAADVRRACELACLAPVLARLPAGLETGIAERGVNLSGGQKQRLALARGILAARGSSLVMLDEPTSSMDPVTEAQIYENLLREFPDACLVSSIHRLHLLPRFDTVVLMEEGRVIDVGTPDELLARQPRFRTLWQGYAGSSLAA